MATERLQVRRRFLVAMLVVALLVAMWGGVAAQQRSRVVLWFDGQRLVCADTDPVVTELDEDVLGVAISAAIGLDCQFRVHVENRGWSTATMRAVTLPFHGPATGASVRATSLSPFGQAPRPDEDWMHGPPIDAVWDIDHPIQAGERVTLTIHLEFNPDGCLSEDGRLWLSDAPIVTVAVLGRTGERTPPGVAIAHQGTEDSSCDT